jgi:transposase-like protein
MDLTSLGEAAKWSWVIQIDEGKIHDHLGEVVRRTVEEMLNALLNSEADRLCRPERYEHTEARKDTRDPTNGSYKRKRTTSRSRCRSYARYRLRRRSLKAAGVEKCGGRLW